MAFSARRGEMTWSQVAFIPLFGFVAGFFGGLLLQQLQRLFEFWRTLPEGAGLWLAVSWGAPLVVTVFLLAGTLHIGLLKLLIAVHEQEWWARLGGLLALTSVAWAALFGLTVFVPLAFVAYSGWIKTKLLLLGGWITSTAWGLLIGRSAKTSGTPKDGSKTNFAALVAPYIFVAGLIVMLSLAGTDAVRLPGPSQFAKAHGVLGTIHYPQRSKDEPAFTGELLYIKATVTEKVPRDVLAYRDAHPAFPDDTTADQWFDESQFESYRRLGLYSLESLAGLIRGRQASPKKLTITQLFDLLRKETAG